MIAKLITNKEENPIANFLSESDSYNLQLQSKERAILQLEEEINTLRNQLIDYDFKMKAKEEDIAKCKEAIQENVQLKLKIDDLNAKLEYYEHNPIDNTNRHVSTISIPVESCLLYTSPSPRDS